MEHTQVASPSSCALLPEASGGSPTPTRRSQADDGEFVALATKHTFNLGTLGILLGMLVQLQGGWAAGCLRHCKMLAAAALMWWMLRVAELQLLCAVHSGTC